MIENYFKTTSKEIKSGEKYYLYIKYCNACKIYKRILASPPCGPGGTLSCPICTERKEHGPHLEGAYGSIITRTFKIILPSDVDFLKPTTEGEE